MSVSGWRQPPESLDAIKRLPSAITALALVTGLVVPILLVQPVYAAGQITNRKLELQANGANGGSAPGVSVKHQFTFTPATSTNIGSVKFEYCTTASVNTCVTPPGLATSFASTTLTAQSGAGAAFSATSTSMATSGAPYITRASSAMTITPVSFQLTGVTNPTAANTTFFVRISTYASTDTTGAAVDAGSVAASTANPIVLTGTMPESLIFCTGATISMTGSVPNCASATAGSITFNQLFSPSDTATATSQMAASTNATFGYNITVNGVTMTSGSNTVTAMGTATTGLRGTGQFGLNLATNTTTTSTPAVGAPVNPTSNITDLRANPQTGYATADTFKFTSGDSVAKSDNNSPGNPAATNSQLYTSSYIVNVPGSQPAGTYTTTLTYICTPTF